MYNILAKVPHREKARFAAHLKQIWLEPEKRAPGVRPPLLSMTTGNGSPRPLGARKKASRTASVLRLPGGRQEKDLLDQRAGAAEHGNPPAEPGSRVFPSVESYVRPYNLLSHRIREGLDSVQ